MSKHLASCGSIGMWGRRVGTTYAHTPRAAWGLYGNPWFRFRNAECERICREAWAQPAPTEGEYFVVIDKADVPDVRFGTRAVDALRKCSLARWEGDALPWGRSRLYQEGDTDVYQWYVIGNDYSWSPAGRPMRLNDAGRALLAAERGL